MPWPRPTYSFVIPALDEEEGLPELHRRLSAVAESLDGPAEFVLVDDDSRDGTAEAAEALRSRDPRLKLVTLSRNFGHQIAISAGLDFASGDAIVIMDADLQDPPEVVPEMAERWREGNDVVYAVRRRREGETRFKRASASLYYRVMKRLTAVEVPIDAGDFRLIDRRVAEIVSNMPEPDRFLRGMFAWVGFEQTAVLYERAARVRGESKYSFAKTVRFAADGLLSFSTVPLKLTLAVGFALAALALAAGVGAILLELFGAFTTPGWALLVVALSFFSGLQLVVLGTIGLYVGRIYSQGKQRPLYLVDSAVGFTEDDAPGRGSGSGERPARTLTS